MKEYLIKTMINSKKDMRKIVDKIKMWIDGIVFRSYWQVAGHFVLATIIAVGLSVILDFKIVESNGGVVTYLSSIVAASGALLAVTIAVSFFANRNFTEERDKYIDKLAYGRGLLRKQMEHSASKYPDISRKLAPLYELCTRYTRGREVKEVDTSKAYQHFFQWAKAVTKGKESNIDVGEESSYDSFEMHLRDALVCALEVKLVFTSLTMSYGESKTVMTFASLIVGWVLVLGVSVFFAMLESVVGLSGFASFIVVFVTFYSLIIATVALMFDITTILKRSRRFEEGWEQVMNEIESAKLNNE